MENIQTTVSVVVQPKPSQDGALRLHVGGREPKEGWKILNIQPGPNVDFVGTVTDLSQFADNSVDEIYGSHVYEHLDYKGSLVQALQEAHRVLKPGGVFRAAVPDLTVLAHMLLNPQLTTEQKFEVMRMIFGGHVDQDDYHYVGLTEEFFTDFLNYVGFTQIQRVRSFGLFKDTSDLVRAGVRISLNMMAVKPLK